MKIIEFIKHYIRFNLDPDNEESVLFTILFVLLFPIIMIIIFYKVESSNLDEYFNKRAESKERFWDEWKKLRS